MISQTEAPELISQIKRLAALKGWRREPSFEEELLRICLKYGSSVVLLKMAVDRILEGWDHCPMPAELLGILQQGRTVTQDDPIPRWQAEFRAEIRKALLAQEQLGDCRERRDRLTWLEYATCQHPDFVNQERARMGLRPVAEPPQMSFPTGKASKPAEPMTPAAALLGGVLDALKGKNSESDYARLRRAGIRDALYAVDHPRDGDSKEANAARQFWADHLSWAEIEHPAEVQQIRGEPQR